MNNQNASIMSLPPGLSSVPNTPDDFQLFINHSDEHQQTARQAVGVHQEEIHRLQQQTEQAYAELAQKYRQLLQKYSQDSEDLKNEAESRRMWQGRFNEKQKELERLQVSTVCQTCCSSLCVKVLTPFRSLAPLPLSFLTATVLSSTTNLLLKGTKAVSKLPTDCLPMSRTNARTYIPRPTSTIGVSLFRLP